MNGKNFKKKEANENNKQTRTLCVLNGPRLGVITHKTKQATLSLSLTFFFFFKHTDVGKLEGVCVGGGPGVCMLLYPYPRGLSINNRSGAHHIASVFSSFSR
jgi:hypothetical protein